MSIQVSAQDKRSNFVFYAGISVLICILVFFTTLQYMMPPDFTSGRGLNQGSIQLFSKMLGIRRNQVPVGLYTTLFRSTIVGAVLFHIGLSHYCKQVKTANRRVLFAVIMAANLFLAIFFPASLSSDIFNYAATAHLLGYYHLNPYVNSPLILAKVHDPALNYIGLGFSSIYGPVWTYLSTLMIIGARSLGLFAQILGYKLLEAASLTGISVLVKCYCDRSKSVYGTAAMLAVGLNPLLLIEGPGNGHNDILMMVFFMLALLQWGKSLWKCGVCLGLAISIKFVPLALLPWAALSRQPRNRRATIWTMLVFLCCALGPTILLMPPFWAGGSALHAFFTRINLGSTLVNEHSTAAMSRQIVTTSATSSPLRALHSQLGLILYYAFLTCTVCIRSRKVMYSFTKSVVQKYIGRLSIPTWAICWIAFVSLAEFFGRGYWFSWYYSWAIIPAACCWSRRGNIIFMLCMALALADTINYSIS